MMHIYITYQIYAYIHQYIKTLEDSGINVKIEPTDENHIDHIDNDEEWKSIGTLED